MGIQQDTTTPGRHNGVVSDFGNRRRPLNAKELVRVSVMGVDAVSRVRTCVTLRVCAAQFRGFLLNVFTEPLKAASVTLDTTSSIADIAAAASSKCNVLDVKYFEAVNVIKFPAPSDRATACAYGVRRRGCRGVSAS